MKRRTKVLIGVGVLVVGGGAGGVVMSRRGKDVTPVTFGKVERMNLTSKVSANGRIDAKRKADLSANVMGQVVNLAVREGDIVRRGDFLLQIDQKQLAATASGAEASLRAVFSDRDAARANALVADQELARAQKNFDQRIISTAELDRARSARDAASATLKGLDERIGEARANLTAARDTLSKTTMRAPMDGMVTSLPVHEGEVAVIGTMNNAGTKLMTIADMSVVEAVIEVDETDMPNVRIGQQATVTIDAYPNKKFSGVVTDVGSSPIQRNATGGQTGGEAIDFEVKIQLENPPPGVRPGFTASAEIVTGTRSNVLAIPLQALVVREKPGAKGGAKPEDEEGVFVREGGVAKFAPVKTGLTGEGDVEIVSGLRAGQQIVTGPFRALREIKDGSKVKEQEAGKSDH